MGLSAEFEVCLGDGCGGLISVLERYLGDT